MRAPALFVLLLSACGMKAEAPAADCLLNADAGVALFGKVPADAAAPITAAAKAGEVVAAASKQAEDFDTQMVAIAADPDLSAQWAKVATDPAKARTAGLAADLPANASALRTDGIPPEEVKTAVEGASKARMSASEVSDAFAAADRSIQVWGPIDGFGAWFVSRVEAGDRGPALVDDIEVEHQSRGKKVGDEKSVICHRPPGNPNNSHTLSVGASAVSAHLNHGDTLGPCPGDDGKGKGHDEDGDDDGHGKMGKGHGEGHGEGHGKGKGKGKGGH